MQKEWSKRKKLINQIIDSIESVYEIVTLPFLFGVFAILVYFIARVSWIVIKAIYFA